MAGPDHHMTTDLDEHGYPVTDRYRRLGANGTEAGLFVRFEPGFGLNVHIGWRKPVYKQPLSSSWRDPDGYVDEEKLVVGIKGWETLGALVDEWREREAG